MSKHHSFEEKLRYMKLLDGGYPIHQLSRDFNISRTRLYDWCSRYLFYGEDDLKRKVPHIVSEEGNKLIRIEMGKIRYL